jgi:hypothetical protein
MEDLLMEPEADLERNADKAFCPECGAEESGYFCRSCGALLRGEDLVLCPRCHQIVPGGGYCNQCGQSLGGIALDLRQLAVAGGEFWVTSSAIPTGSAPAESEADFLAEDDLQQLEHAELPDWLQEMPVPAASDAARVRVYPALQPVPPVQAGAIKGRFLIFLILLMGLMLLGLVVVTILVLIQAGWSP